MEKETQVTQHKYLHIRRPSESCKRKKEKSMIPAAKKAKMTRGTKATAIGDKLV